MEASALGTAMKRMSVRKRRAKVMGIVRFVVAENMVSGLLSVLGQDVMNGKMRDFSDMYGYEMVQALAEYSEGNFCLQESSLYPTLYRLQDKKCISARQVSAGKRRMRTYYHLEPAGKDYLQQSLREYLSVQKGFYGILDKTGNSGDEK